MTATFAHVALNCHDIATTARFYEKHFGFRTARVVDLGENKQIVFLKSGDIYLELFQAEAISPVAAATNDGPTWPGVRHIAFQVQNVDAKLAAIGNEAKLSFGPFDFDGFIPGWRTAWIVDPDGNIVEISQGFKDDAKLLAASPAAATANSDYETTPCAMQAS